MNLDRPTAAAPENPDETGFSMLDARGLREFPTVSPPLDAAVLSPRQSMPTRCFPFCHVYALVNTGGWFSLSAMRAAMQ